MFHISQNEVITNTSIDFLKKAGSSKTRHNSLKSKASKSHSIETELVQPDIGIDALNVIIDKISFRQKAFSGANM